jgi:hypothetical protein
MAVVQISRIQIRRGQANQGTGLPQLASGEMAWAIDTQQLFIGNGSIAEGSPAVGNTRILTTQDFSSYSNLLSALNYTYKIGSAINTGPSPSAPVTRSYQQRFDDNVTAYEFGARGDGLTVPTDDTAALQRAIYQLFLNPAQTSYSSSLAYPSGTPAAVQTRVKLNIPPGIYYTTSTIYIPSYATLVGAGANKTQIYFNPPVGYTGPAIQIVNDYSTTTAINVSATDSTHQPRHIQIKGMTITSASGTNTCMQLDSVRDSMFEDLILQGNWGGNSSPSCIGIAMSATGSALTCENNTFKDIKFKSFTYSISTKWDILNNIFENCRFDDALQAISLGASSNGLSDGQIYGPRTTQILNSNFVNIRQQALYIEKGSNNALINAKMINVGNNGTSNTNINDAYPQIYFGTYSNSVVNCESDRALGAQSTSGNFADGLLLSNYTVKYIPELAGHGSFTSFGFINPSPTGNAITYNASPQQIFRLPVNTTSQGIPNDLINYEIKYYYKSSVNNFSRRGTMTIAVDITAKTIHMSDDFDFAGTDTTVNTTSSYSLQLSFFAVLTDIGGNTYAGSGYGNQSGSGAPYGIMIYYTNKLSSDQGEFGFSYTTTQ